jgi:hypothetical protein
MIENIIKSTEDNINTEDKHDQGLLSWDHDSNPWSCLSSVSILSSVDLIIFLIVINENIKIIL